MDRGQKRGQAMSNSRVIQPFACVLHLGTYEWLFTRWYTVKTLLILLVLSVLLLMPATKS